MWFAPLLLGGAQLLAGGVTISRPNSDITVTGWVGDPDNTNLYANIDEATASDTDFIISPDVNGTPGAATFGISPTQTAGSFVVSVRAKKSGTAGQLRVILRDASNTAVGTSAWQSLTSSFVTYNINVTTTGTAARVSIEVQP